MESEETCNSHIEDLPPEFRTQIMLSVPDIPTLNALIRASKRYYTIYTESPDYYLQAALSSQTPPRCLRYAYAQVLAGEANPPLRKNYKRTIHFLRQHCGVKNLLEGNAAAGNEHLDDAWNVPTNSYMARKIFLESQSSRANQFADAYCVKTLGDLYKVTNEAQKIVHHDALTGSISEMHRLYGILHFINLFSTLFTQLRTDTEDSTQDVIEYYDAHTANSFNSELMSQMSPDTIPDRRFEDIQTDLEELEEDKWPEYEWQSPGAILLCSLTLWERQEVYVLYKYLLEEVNLSWIRWSTWGIGTPPLEELSGFDLEASHMFTPRC